MQDASLYAYVSARSCKRTDWKAQLLARLSYLKTKESSSLIGIKPAT